jgi:hypothetical protein
MKRCPTCNRSYPDESVRFCLEDGAALTDEITRAPSTQEAGHSPNIVPTIQAPYETAAWPTPSASASTPDSNERRRRPWILAVIAVLAIALTATLIAAIVHRNASSVANSVPNQNNNKTGDETKRLSELTTLESEFSRAIVEGDKADKRHNRLVATRTHQFRFKENLHVYIPPGLGFWNSLCVWAANDTGEGFQTKQAK